MTDRVPLYAVIIMAVATYALRVGGLAVARFTRGSERASAFLQRVSQGALIGIVVAASVGGDWAARAALVAAALAAALTRNLLLSMLTGALFAAAWRAAVAA
jgi:uncharacterized membrane protein